MGLRDEIEGMASGGTIPQITPASTSSRSASLRDEIEGLAARTIPRPRSGPESIEAEDQTWGQAIGGNLLTGIGSVYGSEYNWAARKLAGSPLDVRIGGTNLSEYLGTAGSAIDQWRKDHPEYSPARADGVVELLTTPKALVGRTVGGLPYVANTAAAAMIPGVGVPAAFGLSYVAEGQAAYEDAKASGATDAQAERAGEITGVINGAIEMLQVGKLFKIFRGASHGVQEAVVNKAVKKAVALGLGGEVLKDVGKEAAQEMLQGAVEEGVAQFVYDKDYEGGWKGYVDRRLQEAVGAVALSGLTAGAGHVAGRAMGEPESEALVKAREQADAFDRKDLEKVFKEKFKLPVDAIGDSTQSVMQIADAMAETYARQNGVDRATAYARMFAEPNTQELSNSVLFQTTDNVRGFYSKLETVLDSEKFAKSFGDKPAEASAIKAFLTKEGVKEEELEWTGLRGMLAEAEKAGVRVDKKQLGEYLSKHAVKLDTVVKGADKANELAAKREQLEEQYREIDKKRTQYAKKAKVTPQEQEEYRQLSLQSTQISSEISRLSTEERLVNPRHGGYTARGPKQNYTEVLLRFPQRVFEGETQDDGAGGLVKKGEEKVLFSNPAHWEEPNVIVHLRYDTRWSKTPEEAIRKTKTAELYRDDDDIDMAELAAAESDEVLEQIQDKGDKILFVNEIQSDWHQEGRQVGYSKEENIAKQEVTKQKILDLAGDKVSQLEDEMRTLALRNQQLLAPLWEKTGLPKGIPDLTLIADSAREHLGEAVATEFRNNVKQIKELEQQVDKFDKDRKKAEQLLEKQKEGPVEPGPQRATWVDLALKKIMLDAVEKGFDRVAFASGEIQAEIYGALSEEQRQGQSEFYDKILPNKVKDLLKKIDPGVKLEVVDIASGTKDTRYTGKAYTWMELEEAVNKIESSPYATKKDLQAANDLRTIIEDMHDGNDLEGAVESKIMHNTEEWLNEFSQIVRAHLPRFDITYGKSTRKVLSFKISDKIKQKLIDEGLPLFQSVKRPGGQLFGDVGFADNKGTKLYNQIGHEEGGVVWWVDISGRYHEQPATLGIHNDVAKGRVIWGRIDDKKKEISFASRGAGPMVTNEARKIIESKYDGYKVYEFGTQKNEAPGILYQSKAETPQVFNDLGSYLAEFNPEAAQRLKTGELTPEEAAQFSRDMASERANYMSAPLFQTNKASTRFLQDGRAVLSALHNPDISSAIHELGHVARRHILRGEDLKAVEDWAGVKQGVWAVEHEERFAKAFEKYIREGKAPSSTLVTAFGKLKQWMRQIYKKIADLGLDRDINDDIRAVFDRMLAEESNPVAAQRELIKSLREQKKAIGKTDDPGQMLERERLTDEIVQAEEGLRQLQESSFQPGVPSPAEQRWTNAEALPPISDPDTFKELRGLKWWWPAFKNTFAFQGAVLEHFSAGRLFMQLLDNATETRKSLVGELELEFRDLMIDMGPFQSEAKWLTQRDPDGFSNMQKLVEEVGVPEDKRILPMNDRQVRIKKFVKRIQDFMTSKAIEEAIQRRMPSGDLATIRRSMKERLPRMLMEDAWRAIEKQNGKLYNAIVNTALKWNPELKNFEGAHRAIQAQYGREAIKKVGVLEKARTIKIMPDSVQVDGVPTAIFHAEPYTLLDHLIEQQAMRVAFIKEFGQGVMRNLRSKWDPKKGEWVGNRGPIRKLLSVLGKDVKPFSKLDLINKLLDVGVTPTGNESLNKLRAVARQYDIPVSPDYLELIGKVMLLREADVDKRRIPKLRQYAKKIKGIDSRLPVPELLNAIKQRLTTDVEDNLLNRLRDRYGREGGDVEHFDAVAKVWQGLPYGWLARNPLTRTFRLYGDIIGTAHTSLSVIRNIVQTATQVPQMGGVMNFLGGLGDVFQNYEKTRDASIAVGAMKPVMYSWRSETGYGLETLGRNLRQVAGKLTGMRWIGELNETIAAATGKRLADDWIKHGFGKADVGVAKNLRLTDEEIDGLLKRQPMKQSTYRKIIQTMVAETQYTTQAEHRKALAENVPLIKSLFSYQSYTYGATRNALELVKETKDAVRSGDPARTAAALVRVATLVGTSYGVGIVGKMLVGAIKGQPPRKEDEGWWDTVLGSLVETQLLGIGTRLIDPFQYANGSADKWLLGFMPQIRSLGSLVELLVNTSVKLGVGDTPMGKFGRFPLGTQLWEQVKSNTPALKAISTWTEKSIYPEFQEYQKVRNLVGEYETALAGGSRSTYSNEPMNPDYYGVFQAIARNDPDQAVQQAREYYRDQRSKGIPTGVARRQLRQSLMSRRPIALSLNRAREFARGLPEDRKKQVLEVQKRYVRLMNRVAPTLED